MFKPNEQNEADVRILANFIKVKLIDEKAAKCSYGELSAALGGRDIQYGDRSILDRARKSVEKEHGVYIGTIYTEGIALVDDLSGAADRTIRHISRASKRASRRILNAVNDDIPKAAQVGIFARISTLGALSIFTRQKSIKKIEGRIIETGQKELPTAETLRLFEK